jgi:prepilin-type N-terminal cleavage/methylation domain-containing protein
MKRVRLLQRSLLRAGYTLVEILIVVGILVVLLTMTLMTVRFTRDGDRVTAAAGQIQSFLAGARDRAIYARAPRGVRLFLDTNNPRTVSSMVYIDPSESWNDGVIQLRRWDPELDGATNTGGGPVDINQDGSPDDPKSVWMVVGEGTAWWELKRRGLLFDGMRIRIPRGPGGSWYPINTRLIDLTSPPPTTQILVLGIPYRDPGNTPAERSQAFESGGPEDYEILLAPRILPGEPAALPEGTVIDLDGSRIPDSWRPSSTLTGGGTGNALYSQYIDIVYSPRGSLVGDAASGGVLHLYVCDREDSVLLKEEYLKSLNSDPAVALNVFNASLQTANGGLKFLPSDAIDPGAVAWAAALGTPGEPYNVRDRRVVTISGQTGAVSIHLVNAADGDSSGSNPPDGFADDPYFYAETGETAK